MITVPVKFTNVGMTSDTFDRNVARVRALVHFDPSTLENQLTPFHASENGDTSASTNQIGAFCFANSLLYGLSFASGLSQKLFSKSDNSTQTWPGNPANMTITATYDGNCFVDYKGKLFMSRAAQLDSYDYGGASLVTNVDSASYAVINQGVVHPATGYLYLPIATKVIYSTNGTSFSTAFTLPDTNYSIQGICVFGNSLAINAYNISIQKSVVLLWNLDTSVTTVSENIDFGSEKLIVLESLGGNLIGISQYQASNSAFSDRMILRQYSGGAPVGETFGELVFSGTTLVITKPRQRINHRIYFMLTGTYNGNAFQGVASIGTSGNQFTITLDRLANGDTGLTSGTMNGFILTSDYMYISYISSATYGMSKTDDQATYTATSYVETLTNPGCSPGDYALKKALQRFQCNFNTMSSGHQIVAKYRVDGGSWKTIFTKTFSSPSTDPSTYASNREGGAGHFDQGTHYEFRIEATGGAVPTGYEWSYVTPAQQQ